MGKRRRQRGISPFAVAVMLSAAACSSDSTADRGTPASTAPEPCALADAGAVATVLGDGATVAVSTSDESPDGVGLVLNCLYEAAGDTSRALAFTQRLGFGRDAFVSSRDSMATAEIVDDDSYWLPDRLQLLHLDGDDLVAIRLVGVDADLVTAQTVMSAAIGRRRGG